MPTANGSSNDRLGAELSVTITMVTPHILVCQQPVYENKQTKNML